MKTYFSLQWKRARKVLPSVLTVTVVLFAALTILLLGLLSTYNRKEQSSVFKVGVTGDTDNDILRMAMVAFQDFDEGSFSVEFIEMEKADADQGLKDGTLSAYLELPDNFIENAMRGDMEPMYYVTSAGADNIVTMFKNEITALITDVVITSQQGSYGLQDVLDDHDVDADHSALINDLALEYVNLVLHRTEALTIRELGISEGMRMSEYYLCGMTLLFLMLLGMPFVTVYAREDRSLNALLLSRGVSGLRQVYDEWLSHFLSLLCLAAVVFVPVLILSSVSDHPTLQLLSATEWMAYVILFIPVLGMVAAFNLLIFELGGNIVSGTLLHFFVVLCMCYVSGCFYPVYAFPRAVQAVERFLPTGVAREGLAVALSEEASLIALVGVVGYGLLLFFATWLLRMHKLRRREGVSG